MVGADAIGASARKTGLEISLEGAFPCEEPVAVRSHVAR